MRLWVLGDSGTANEDAAAVRDAYLADAAGETTDAWIMLGDNAYLEGMDDEYQRAVFEQYPSLLRNTVLWPILGNHDVRSVDVPAQTGPYFDLFHLPTAGECGGAPSGTEAYWSFDRDNVHVIGLDTEGRKIRPGGEMLRWLEADLSANDADWTLVCVHNPPYSKGGHDSDEPGEETDVRELVVPILERYGVDLVLAGHSHGYERSCLLDGHHGLSSELEESMRLDPGDGRADGDGVYHKPSYGPAPHEGAVFVVAGNGGKLSDGDLDHPAMIYSDMALGSVVIEIDGDRLDARFLRETGAEDDHFSIVKGPPAEQAKPRPLTEVFADGTLGRLQRVSGRPRVRAEGVEADGACELRVPQALHREPRLVAEVAGGLAVGDRVGVLVQETAGPQAGGARVALWRVQVEHVGGGDLQASLERDGVLLGTGPRLPLGADQRAFLLFVRFDAGSIRVELGGREALLLPRVSAARPARVSLALEPAPSSSLRLEWVAVRERGVVPDVHFDADGTLWLALFEEDFVAGLDPSAFLYHEDRRGWTWGTFLREVLPLFDRREAVDQHVFVFGRTNPPLPGTLVGLSYRGELDQDADGR